MQIKGDRVGDAVRATRGVPLFSLRAIMVPVVVAVALRNKAVILTGDRRDMERLVRASGRAAVVVNV